MLIVCSAALTLSVTPSILSACLTDIFVTVGVVPSFEVMLCL